MKLIRHLAALAPLVAGVILGGCGGILGSVEGNGPVGSGGPGTQATQFTVRGTVALEASVGTVPTSGTVAVLRATGPGNLTTPLVSAPVATGSITGGAFAVPVTVAVGNESQLNDLWVVETIYPGAGSGGTNVVLMRGFVPSASVTANTTSGVVDLTSRPVNAASTLVAGNLLASAPTRSRVDQTGIDALVTKVSVTGVTLAVFQQGSTDPATAARNLLGSATFANAITTALNSAVGAIRIFLTSSTVTQADVTSKAFAVGQSDTVTLTAKAFADAAATQELPDAGFTVRTNNAAAVVTKVDQRTVTITVPATAALNSQIQVTAEIARPGVSGATVRPEGENTVIVVVQHGQGHFQAGGTSF